MTEPLEFTASVAKVQTLVDGGIRVTLDLPESETLIMAKLAECQRWGAGLEISARPLINSKDQDGNGLAKGTKRKSSWAPTEA